MAALTDRELEDRAIFKRRLEAFSDIVFGFMLSQSALQLVLPARAADLFAHPIRWVIFFGTFAVIAAFWLAHYRTFRLAFEPEPFDVFLNFVFLAAVAILPFAMQATIRFDGDRGAYTLYAGSFAGISITMAILHARGLLRRNPRLSARQQLQLWQAFIRYMLVAAASLSAIVSLSFQPSWAASLVFFALAVAVILTRRFVRTVPARFLPEPTHPSSS